MVDTTPNPVSASLAPTQHSRPVIRTPVEVNDLERQLANVRTSEEKSNLYVQILTKLIGHLSSHVDKKRPREYQREAFAEWRQDRARIDRMKKDFFEVDGPSADTPFLRPMYGTRDEGTYLIRVGPRALSFLRSEDLAIGVKAIMGPQRDQAYDRACKVYRRLHEEAIELMDKYGQRTWRSEFATTISNYGEGDINQEFDADSAPPETPDEDEDEDDLDGSEEDSETTEFVA